MLFQGPSYPPQKKTHIEDGSTHPKAVPEGSAVYMALYNQHMNIWDSDDSSYVKSHGTNHKAGSEDENVSDENVDEDEISETNLVYAATVNAHLESGVGSRLKNSF
jgi:hypothetical protein